MKIDFLKPEEISNVVDIHRKCVSEINSLFYPPNIIDAWLSQITQQDVKDQLNSSCWVVMRDAGKIVGFCQYSVTQGEIFQIQIDPIHQDKGYGAALYKFIEKDFVKNNKTKVFLNSTLNAVPFYEKMGFTKEKNILFSLGNNIEMEMVRMTKKLFG